MSDQSAQSAGDLAVAICAHNSMRTLPRTLESVQPIARRVVVVDSGSTDGTIEMAQSMGADVIEHPWEGHVKSKQFALDQCADHAWVLNLDSDESLDEQLAKAIGNVVAEDDANYNGWALNRKTWFLGGWLHHTFQPEWRLRLVRGGIGRIIGRPPHDRMDVPGKVGQLPGFCRHDSWIDVADMYNRHLGYGQLIASQTDRGGRLLDVVVRPPAAFLKHYLLGGGVRDGARGLIACGGVAIGTMMKHLAIAQRRAGLDKPDDPEAPSRRSAD